MDARATGELRIAEMACRREFVTQQRSNLKVAKALGLNITANATGSCRPVIE